MQSIQLLFLQLSLACFTWYGMAWHPLAGIRPWTSAQCISQYSGYINLQLLSSTNCACSVAFCRGDLCKTPSSQFSPFLPYFLFPAPATHSAALKRKSICRFIALPKQLSPGSADSHQPLLWLLVGWSQFLAAQCTILCNLHSSCFLAQLCVYVQGRHVSFQQLHRPTALSLAKSFLKLQMLAKYVSFTQEASNSSTHVGQCFCHGSHSGRCQRRGQLPPQLSAELLPSLLWEWRRDIQMWGGGDEVNCMNAALNFNFK